MRQRREGGVASVGTQIARMQFRKRNSVEPSKPERLFGEGTFNFASRGGRFVIGAESWAFDTRWSSACQGTVHRYSDAAGIEGVAIAEGVGTIGRAMGPPTSSTFNDR